MRFYTTLLAVAPLLLQVRADLDLDLDDVPSVCRDTCRPVAQLADRCHVDLRGDDNDRQEDLLEAQCFCTNGSFDVEAVSALCLDCIRQNYNSTSTDRDDDHDHDDHHDGDDDDWDDHDHDDHHTRKRDHDDHDDDHDDHDDAWKDINDIVRTCSFSSTSWSAQAAATSVSVSAERPTDASQLTTTFTAASQTSGGNSPIQTSPSDDNSNDDNSNDDNSNSNSGDNNDDGGAAAGLAAPVFMAGALVVGAAAFLV